MIPSADKKYFKDHGNALLQLIPFLVLGIGVPIILSIVGIVNSKWLFMGAVTWLLALGLKTIPLLISFIFPGLHIRSANIYFTSIAEGFLSAIAELGLTLAYFLYNLDELSLNTIISFGLGVGFAEILLVLYLLLEEVEKISDKLKKEKTKGFVLWRPLLERLLALAGHVFSRGIIGLVILYAYPYWVIVLPLLSFAFIDGWAGYISRKWDMTKTNVLRRINYIHVAVVIFEAALFLFFMLVTRVLTT